MTLLRRLLLLLWGTALFAGPPQRPPSRVVSQTVGTDELLLALARPEQVAALSHISRSPDYSAAAKEAAAYPQLRNSDAESVLSFRPDLVLLASYTRAETKDLLRRAGVRILEFDHFDSLEDTYANLRLLGDALGRRERAEAVIRDCQARVAALEKRLAGAAPVWVIAPSPYGLIGGRHTTFDDVCQHAGAINAAAAAGLEGHAPTPSEQVLGWRVDALVLEGSDGPGALARVRELPPFKFLPATRAGRYALLPGPLMSSVSQYRVDAYEALARALHPDRFK